MVAFTHRWVSRIGQYATQSSDEAARGLNEDEAAGTVSYRESESIPMLEASIEKRIFGRGSAAAGPVKLGTFRVMIGGVDWGLISSSPIESEPPFPTTGSVLATRSRKTACYRQDGFPPVFSIVWAQKARQERPTPRKN